MQSGRGLLRMAEVCRLSGLTDQTIRFYERKGLIRPEGRTPKGHRVYSMEVVRSLNLIKTAQSLGFSLDEILAILRADPSQPASCAGVRVVMANRVRVVRELADLLERVEAQVQQLLHHCGACDGPGCPLLEDLDRGPGTPGPRRCVCLGNELDPDARLSVGVRRVS